MDAISLEKLALKDFLTRIDQGVELAYGDDAIRKRMVQSALIEDDEPGLHLTSAGLELCKSLQHRVAVDTQAKKALPERAASES